MAATAAVERVAVIWEVATAAVRVAAPAAVAWVEVMAA